MTETMEKGCGIYRQGDQMQATCDRLAELKSRYRRISLADKSRVWNTDWTAALELGFQLDIAQAMAASALARRESRGAHQRLDGFEQRDDVHYLCHSLAHFRPQGPPEISYAPVTITRSPPGVRAYGALGQQAEQAPKESSHA
jgi:fumarate reductase flavoprotein subunit